FSLPEPDSGETSPLKQDFEGVALFRDKGGEQYLLLSSQGNHRYALIATRTGHLSDTFAISPNTSGDKVIDGVAETDGLDVTTRALGAAFPNGLLVVQDGFNTDPEAQQNFKYVDWGKVMEAVTLSPYPAPSQKAD
ncbi:MAG: phytase, partial [Alphaproteobacteria bacterium]|nr:phytase [Alphaproteobacteria bacterium]